MLAFFLIGSVSFAQSIQKSIDDLTSTTNAELTINKNSEVPEFIKFPRANPPELEGATVYEKSISFLERYKGIYSIKSVETSFQLEGTKTDNYGFKHVTLIQTHQGVAIFDGQLKFHFNQDEQLTSINGNYIPNIKLSPVPNLSTAQAGSNAIETVSNQDINFSGAQLVVKESRLYFFQKGLVQGYRGADHLVYRIEVANDMDVREFVFVDAHDGTIVEQFTGIAHAIDRIVFEGDTSTIAWQEGDPFPGLLTNWQQNLVIASEHTYNFFNNAFGYVSYDGIDAQMEIVNNLDAPGFCPNASWNGATINFCDGTATDDIIGHEWGHAYTEYTSNLVYAYQSGAINEAYSDIWGETIDLINNYEDDDENLAFRTACNSSDRWLLGEDAASFGGAIRDMWDPTCFGHPGKVTDGEYWCTGGDNGGVHINSGIPNHAYALLVEGGNFNGQTITGIGFTKAAHIFWRAQSEYLTTTSDFPALADALDAACSDLIGINLEGLSTAGPIGPSGEIITASDCIEVANVILAVELRMETGCPDVITILDPLENELCDEATNAPIFFEDWESGLGSWTLEQAPVNPDSWVPRDWQIFNGPEANRVGNIAYGPTPAIGDCNTSFQNGIIRLISPVITMPDNPEATFEMAFNHAIAIETDWDGGNIKYSLNGGAWTLLPLEAFIENGYNFESLRDSDNPLSGEPGFTGLDFGTYLFWGTSVIDLSSLGVVENTTIQFSFDLGTDGCGAEIGWGIDEVMVYTCEALSINDFALDNAYSVYPNPSNGNFTLNKTSNIDLLEATIYDINGRQIKSINLENMGSSELIDLSNAASGIYFMSITSNTSKQVVKLIKQ